MVWTPGRWPDYKFGMLGTGFAMRFLVSLLFSAMLLGAAWAQGIERHGSFLLLGPDSRIAILAGDLTSLTPLDFKTVINRQPQLTTLVLSSPGGSVTGGLLLADEIALRGINTYIPPGFGCHSACSYVFLAGKARMVEGDLGVHQFYGGEESTSQAQFVVSEILDILARFETPQEVISRMLRTPSDDMYIFTQQEVARLGINRGVAEFKAVKQAFRAVPDVVLQAMQPEPPPSQETQVAVGDPQPSAPQTGEPQEKSGERFAIYDGVDFYGADIDKIEVTDAMQCFEACIGNKQCLAVTVNVDPSIKRGPNCFLKDGWGRTEFYEHAISGAFLASGFDGVIQVGGSDVPPTTIIE